MKAIPIKFGPAPSPSPPTFSGSAMSGIRSALLYKETHRGKRLPSVSTKLPAAHQERVGYVGSSRPNAFAAFFDKNRRRRRLAEKRDLKYSKTDGDREGYEERDFDERLEHWLEEVSCPVAVTAPGRYAASATPRLVQQVRGSKPVAAATSVFHCSIDCREIDMKKHKQICKPQEKPEAEEPQHGEIDVEIIQNSAGQKKPQHGEVVQGMSTGGKLRGQKKYKRDQRIPNAERVPLSVYFAVTATMVLYLVWGMMSVFKQ
ncbi:Hypothetical predicted protein [Lecanosticta acicola]|uniref:Uncharacterized protein n=1 Tax=Lecanosticta acicola TaxID=111012 RepID=A0AAI8YWE8_9PEZI|nr:Hypothetical predicted protein [Lecanosticta acicola]